MNLRAVSIYCKVVEKGVMAHAARDLEMTPAAITKAISELEQSLGFRLLNRTTRKLQLTDAGRRYYESCLELLHHADEIQREFSGLATEVRGRLRIAAPMFYGIRYLSEVLNGFMQKYPEVEIVIHLEDRKVDLVEEGYDLAIRIVRDMPDSTMVARAFGEFEGVLVCARNYQKTHGVIQSLADLSHHHCFAYSNARNPNIWSFKHRGAMKEFKFKPRFESNNSSLIKELVLREKGVSIFPSFLVQEELESGKLVRLLPTYSMGTPKGWIVYPSRKFNPAVVTAFAEFFLNWHSKRKA